MRKPANQLEMMESRALLSAAPHAFVFVSHSFDSAQIAPLNVHADQVTHARDEDSAEAGERFEHYDHDGDFHEHPAMHAQSFDGDADVAVWYYEFNGHGGWFGGHVGIVNVPMPSNPPPQGAPQAQDPGDSDGKVTAKPAKAPGRVSVQDAVPSVMADASSVRDSNPVATVATLLHDSADSSAHVSNAMTSPFSGVATIAAQGAVQAGKSNMIYLSFLDQNSTGVSAFGQLVSRLYSAYVRLPAVSLRETGVAVFANGGNILTDAAPKVYEFAHFTSPLMLVADSVGAFIQSSAMLPFAQSPNATPAHRAWMVTATVLGVDAILLGYYYQKRRKAFAALAMETAYAR